jgi:histidinol-phosphatase (PHP family)
LIADYHIHTRASPDAEGSMADCAQVAKKRGIHEIGFSEHVLLRPLKGRSDSFAKQMSAYVHDFVEFQKISSVPVRLGAEIDFFPHDAREIGEFIRKYPFDYVIGSVHVIGDWIFDEPSEMDEYLRRDAWQIYREYFKLVKSAASSRLFDVLGHPDIIKIFGAKPKTDFSHILEETAEAIAEANVCIEINTRGLRRLCQEIYPSEQFLRILHRYNVPITFGSDAHAPEEVGRGFKEATRLAKRVGYTHACMFNRRERASVKI